MLEVLLGNTAAAAVLAGIVLALGRLFHLSPAARHALWLVVIVKLLSPVGFMWSVPLPFEKPRLGPDLPATSATPPVAAALALPASETGGEPADLLAFLVEAGPVADVSALAVDPSNSELGPMPALATENAAIGSAVPAASASAAAPERIEGLTYLWLMGAWLAGAVVVFARYCRRTIRFARYARSGQPASPSMQRQVEELAKVLGLRAPNVRILADLPSPVVWCLWRPVLLWPKGLQEQLTAGGQQAVLIHELAHLRRRDHWVRWLELAAAVMHWWNPLFWLVRRQIRFHAELACDAWVTGTFPEIRRDYAEALLEVCARSSRAAAPSPAVGVGGDGRRDFQRRLTMIMREQVPCRLAAGAKLFVVLLLTAAVPAWTLGQPKPAAKSEAKPQPKIEIKGIEFKDLKLDIQLAPGDAEGKAIDAKIADLHRQIEALMAAKAAAAQAKKAEAPPKMGPEPKFRLFFEAGETFKMPKIGAELLWGLPKQPQFKVIGPDGQEIKGAKVIVVEPGTPAPHLLPKVETEIHLRLHELLKHAEKAAEAAGPKAKVEGMFQRPGVGWMMLEGMDDHSITLKRTTYKLPKDKAASLAAFLKDNIKGPVVETKIEDAGLTVTTTPEIQSIVGSLAKLMSHNQGIKIQMRFHDLKIEPDAPAK